MDELFLYHIISLFLVFLTLSLPVLAWFLLAWRKGGAWRRAFLQGIGLFSLFMGLLLFLGALIGGQTLLSMVFLTIAIGGGYLAYRTYKSQLKNLVARIGVAKNVYYDEKGLYIDKPGKPYLLRWDEVASYEIVDVFARDQYSGHPPILNMISYLIWRDIDPEYALTGIFKFGTMRFYKNDGSVVTLPNVINPDRFTPIFNKYINESNQKKGDHM
ncbi:MAG: hypothetical protein RXQ70_06485 [Sulfolobaceae archaeon]|nr:hypothetical protein [Sulfolobales archaeon]